jgi:predicted nucleotide-binding protein (sugar kinase/HSP70/actin superfamily)
LLQKAATEFAAVGGDRELPVVQLVGEFHIRNDAFANDGIFAKLEARGMRVSSAMVKEWFQHVDLCNEQIEPTGGMARAGDFLKKWIHQLAWEAMARHLPLSKSAEIESITQAAANYISGDVGGEVVRQWAWHSTTGESAKSRLL